MRPEDNYFVKKTRTMESIPPTQDVFLQDCRWVANQSGIWVNSDTTHINFPNPVDFGRKLTEGNKWSPVPYNSSGCL